MAWIIDEQQLSVDDESALAAIFTIGNGTVGTRGTAADAGPGAPRGVYHAGAYVRAGYGLPYPFMGPDWLPARAERAGQLLPVASANRQLDLESGLFRREALLGEGVTLVEERFASFADPQLVAQRVSVSVPSAVDGVSLLLGLDGDVANHLAGHYRPGALPNCCADGIRLARVSHSAAGDGWLEIMRHAPQDDHRFGALARVRQADGPALSGEPERDAGTVAIRYAIPAAERERTYVFEKLVLLATEVAHGPNASDQLRAGRPLLGATGWEGARRQHRQAIDGFWRLGRVDIVGDPEAQRAVRFAVWSARIAAPAGDPDAGLALRGLSGDRDRGAVGWTAEAFHAPLLAALDPERGANQLRYRRARLAAAQILAAQDGYPGARYPWHSYASGFEQPPALPGELYERQFVSLVLASCSWHQLDLDGDRERFVREDLPVHLATARFWAARCTAAEDGSWHVRSITGPDRSHPVVDDVAWINLMIRSLLQRLGDELDRLGSGAAPEPDLELPDAQERGHWAEIAAGLHLPRDGAALAQFAGWRDLAEPDETAAADDGTRADRSAEQPDTLLAWLFARDAVADEDLGATWRAHAPLCHHLAAHAPAVHALLAARLGLPRDTARFYGAALAVDLADAYGDTGRGIHCGAQAALWAATIHGYGGLQVDATGVDIAPALPPAWERLDYRFLHRGQELAVRVTPGGVQVTNHGAQPVELRVAGRPARIDAGAKQQVAYRHVWREQGLEAVVFDLDGVLVTTDKYHYLAWKELADELALDFDESVNHRLRGVSRQESLRRIYAHNHREPPADEAFTAQCTQKNDHYRSLVATMTAADILPGAVELLSELRREGIGIAIASASRNTPLVLERTGLDNFVDAVADGNIVTASKPDPQVFLLAAQRLRVLPWNCVGIEDAEAGVEAIRAAGMVSVGLGETARNAQVCVDDTRALGVHLLRRAFHEHANPRDPYRGRSRSAVERAALGGDA